jgi:hypothetical protein
MNLTTALSAGIVLPVELPAAAHPFVDALANIG